MSENQQTAAETVIQISAEKRREHFTAGMIRWILNESNSASWEKDLPQKCQALALEAKNLGNLPSEGVKKAQATLKAAPAAVLYWLGLYTGFFWVIPGAALGILGSYLISDSIYGIFKAGKDARFFRSFLHYLLRMENADGVISDQELASLRTIIEFIPASSEEKLQWLTAIESPDGYQKLEPSKDLNESEKEQILSGCWGLALCDGSDETEREIFVKFGQELNVSAEHLKRIQQKMEAKLTHYTFLVEETLTTAMTLHPEFQDYREKAADILSLISLKPVSQKEWVKHIERLLAKNEPQSEFKNAEDEFAPQIMLTGLLLARFLSTVAQDTGKTVTDNFQRQCREAGLATRLNTLSASIDQAAASLD
ncbi:MAG: TerB family tellurite resistance protein [Candidatus Riflebacteria bacterium]|nr:TerB family tellurite resistance protein [Candidatus Riflebacteria bacterium]